MAILSIIRHFHQVQGWIECIPYTYELKDWRISISENRDKCIYVFTGSRFWHSMLILYISRNNSITDPKNECISRWWNGWNSVFIQNLMSILNVAIGFYFNFPGWVLILQFYQDFIFYWIVIQRMRFLTRFHAIPRCYNSENHFRKEYLRNISKKY